VASDVAEALGGASPASRLAWLSRLRGVALLSPLTLLGGIGLAQVVLVCACLSLRVPGAANIGSQTRTNLFVAFCCVAAALYFLAIPLVLRRSLPRRALWIVLGGALAMRALTFGYPAFLSSDIYRYVWDGRVQGAGFNPYRYVPAASPLVPLRDGVNWPHVTRRYTARAAYPPAAEAFFYLVTRIGDSQWPMRAAMLLAELLAIMLMLRFLALAGMPQTAVLIYAWNPLPLWEYAANGHVDVLGIAGIALALAAAARRRMGAAGSALALATLCKLMPLALVPAFWRRWDWRFTGAFAATAVVFYLCYIGAGWQVLGYLPDYVHAEGIDDGDGFFLLRLLTLAGKVPSWADAVYLALSLGGLAALAVCFGFGRKLPLDASARIRSLGRQGAVLATALMAVTTPHYPWYFGWLAYFACLAPYPSVIYLSVAPLLLYLGPARLDLPFHALIWLPFLALAARDCIVARRTVLRPASAVAL
jgi:alpha-1,6-mannosyltransferase